MKELLNFAAFLGKEWAHGSTGQCTFSLQVIIYKQKIIALIINN